MIDTAMYGYRFQITLRIRTVCGISVSQLWLKLANRPIMACFAFDHNVIQTRLPPNGLFHL